MIIRMNPFSPGMRTPLVTITLAWSLAALALVAGGGCGGGRFSGPSGPQAMTLESPPDSLPAQGSVNVTVEVTDFSGRPMTTAQVTWETSAPEVVAVSPAIPTGQTAHLAAGPKDGPATITARSGGQVAAFTVTVSGNRPRPLSFSADIQPIFTRSCAQPDCHGGDPANAGEALLLEPANSYDQIVNVPARQVRSGKVMRVLPGQPDASYLLAKMRNTQKNLGGHGSQMPREGDVPAEDLAKIARWIEDGAQRN